MLLQALPKTGVYLIRNKVNGKVYVGSTGAKGGFAKRFSQHRQALNKGCHDNDYLQKAWVKYGEGAFEFVVLEECSPEDCICREQHWMDSCRACDRDKGYNLSPTAGATRGYKWSEESKARLSAACRGRPINEKTREALRRGNTGRRPSEETRAKLSAAKRNPTPETRAKLSAVYRNRSEESISKMVAARSQSNRDRVWTPEMRAKAAARSAGKQATPEARAKMSAAHKGRKMSAETRARMSAARAAYWARKRGLTGDGNGGRERGRQGEKSHP